MLRIRGRRCKWVFRVVKILISELNLSQREREGGFMSLFVLVKWTGERVESLEIEINRCGYEERR